MGILDDVVEIWVCGWCMFVVLYGIIEIELECVFVVFVEFFVVEYIVFDVFSR